MSRRRGTALVFCTVLCLASTSQAAFQQTYLALGDSLAFGTGLNQTATDVSNGDRGYVYGFANLLSTPNGGVRPDLINLGVPGETTGSFLGTGPNEVSPFAWMLNTNYPASPVVDQHDLALSKIASAASSGHFVTTISLQVGADDLFVLANSSAFQTADPATQLSMINSTFSTIQSNYFKIVSDLAAAAPQAHLILMGYYDPYAPYYGTSDPRSVYANFSHSTIPYLNLIISQIAANTPNATFIDLYPLFQGHETDYTYIANPDWNVHPNGAGYGAIVGALQTVPEPSSLVLLGLGGAVLGWTGRRSLRRRAA